MTFRQKPVAKRSARPSRDWSARRHLYLNLLLAVSVILGIVFLVGAWGAIYAGDHFGQIASVNGTQISKDTYRNWLKIETFRIDQTEARLRTENQLGYITDAQLASQISSDDSGRQQLNQVTQSTLVDTALQAQLAAKMGITVNDAQIDQRLIDEATTKEKRHLLMIAVAPVLSTGATTPTDAQDAAAKAKINSAILAIKAGTPFAQVAVANSSDASRSNGGDAGWATIDNNSIDAPFLKAVFALPGNGMTDVIKGDDGTYRVGEVTGIAPPSVDPNWQQEILDRGIPMSAYRDAVRGDLIRDALSARVIADATQKPTVQRQVSEIFLSTANVGSGDQVLVWHILYTPQSSASTASPVPSNDPGWAVAQAAAQATYDKLHKLAGEPSQLEAQFQAIAKTDSKDSSGATGGVLAYYTQDQLDSAFGAAIFKAGLKKDDLLPPVRSQFGWHVILFQDRRPGPAGRMSGLQVDAAKPGADFAALAKANSDGPEAANGGDLGWIARGQIDPTIEEAIFNAPVGKASAVLQTADGLYLFLVRAEASRLPDGTQLTTLKTSVFTNWYSTEKTKANITQVDTTALPSG